MSTDTHSVKIMQLDYLLTHAHRSNQTENLVSHGSKDSFHRFRGEDVEKNNAISSSMHNGTGSGN